MSVLTGASRGRWISVAPCYFRYPLWPGLSLTTPAAFAKGGRVRQKLKPRSSYRFCRRTREHKAGVVLGATSASRAGDGLSGNSTEKHEAFAIFEEFVGLCKAREGRARRLGAGNVWRGRGATGIPPRVVAETAAAPTRKRPRVRRIVLFLHTNLVLL